MYEHTITELKKLYDLFEDETSKRVFLARLSCDIAATGETINQLSFAGGAVSERIFRAACLS